MFFDCPGCGEEFAAETTFDEEVDDVHCSGLHCIKCEGSFLRCAKCNQYKRVKPVEESDYHYLRQWRRRARTHLQHCCMESSSEGEVSSSFGDKGSDHELERMSTAPIYFSDSSDSWESSSQSMDDFAEWDEDVNDAPFYPPVEQEVVVFTQPVLQSVLLTMVGELSQKRKSALEHAISLTDASTIDEYIKDLLNSDMCVKDMLNALKLKKNEKLFCKKFSSALRSRFSKLAERDDGLFSFAQIRNLALSQSPNELTRGLDQQLKDICRLPPYDLTISPQYRVVDLDSDFHLMQDKEHLLRIFRTEFHASLYALDSTSPASQRQFQSFLNLLWSTPAFVPALNELGAPRSLKQLRRLGDNKMPTLSARPVNVTAIPAKTKIAVEKEGVVGSLEQQLALLMLNVVTALCADFTHTIVNDPAQRRTSWNQTRAHGDIFEHAGELGALAMGVQSFIDDYDDLGMGGKSSTGENNKKAVIERMLNVVRRAREHPDFVCITALFSKDAVLNDVLKRLYAADPYAADPSVDQHEVVLMWYALLEMYLPFVIMRKVLSLDKQERYKVSHAMATGSKNGRSLKFWVTEEQLMSPQMPTDVARRTVDEAKEHQDELNEMKRRNDRRLAERETELARRATHDGKPVFALDVLSDFDYFDPMVDCQLTPEHLFKENLFKRMVGFVVLEQVSSSAQPSQATLALIRKLKARLAFLKAHGIPNLYRVVHESILLSYKRWSWMHLQFFASVMPLLLLGSGLEPRSFSHPSDRRQEARRTATTWMMDLIELLQHVFVPNGLSDNEILVIKNITAKVYASEYHYWAAREDLSKLVYQSRATLIELHDTLQYVNAPSFFSEKFGESMFGQTGGMKWARKKSSARNQIRGVMKAVLRSKVVKMTLRRYMPFLTASEPRYTKLDSDDAGAGAEEIPFRQFVCESETQVKATKQQRKRVRDAANGYGDNDFRLRHVPKKFNSYKTFSHGGRLKLRAGESHVVTKLYDDSNEYDIVQVDELLEVIIKNTSFQFFKGTVLRPMRRCCQRQRFGDGLRCNTTNFPLYEVDPTRQDGAWDGYLYDVSQIVDQIWLVPQAILRVTGALANSEDETRVRVRAEGPLMVVMCAVGMDTVRLHKRLRLI